MGGMRNKNVSCLRCERINCVFNVEWLLMCLVFAFYEKKILCVFNDEFEFLSDEGSIKRISY